MKWTLLVLVLLYFAVWFFCFINFKSIMRNLLKKYGRRGKNDSREKDKTDFKT
jgi:hypothetical protein